MRAGELRERIIIQANRPTRDGFNAEVAVWSTFATVWARVETLSGSESITQQAASANLTHRVTIRYLANVAPTMRVSWEDRTLEIVAVVPDDRRREMKLMCTEVVSE